MCCPSLKTGTANNIHEPSPEGCAAMLQW